MNPVPDLSVDRSLGVPLGTQLAWKLTALIQSGEVAPEERLPSVRELARAAGVNVNTARAVYGRLEGQGMVVSEQGRGTFAAAPPPRQSSAPRRALQAQIAELEREVALHPPIPPDGPPPRPKRGPEGALLATEDLERVRDGLLERLRTLDAARQEVLQQLDDLKRSGSPRDSRPPRSSPSLAGVRVRWGGVR